MEDDAIARYLEAECWRLLETAQREGRDTLTPEEAAAWTQLQDEYEALYG
jgi:hypothetical protein